MGERVSGKKEECCGCGVCATICPKSAIRMEYDSEGFLYPVIDDSACVNCGICASNCAFSQRIPSWNLKPESYVVRHQDDGVRMCSRSGGVFVSCSDHIIRKKGSVYGCVLRDNVAEHVRAVSQSDVKEMCKSKYVQSDSTQVYKEIENDLKMGMHVLFSGTACQVDAVRRYLKWKRIDDTRFYAMDLVCHGTPSPRLFSEYVHYLEKKYNGKVEKFDFRDKTICGWDDHIESFVVNNRKYPSVKWRELFYTNAISRPSCGNCKYASSNRIGDITFADAWGVKKAAPEFHDNKGVSSVFVNTDKGHDLLAAMKKDCFVKEVPFDMLVQHNMRMPSLPIVDRKKLWDVYEKSGIEGLIKVYAHLPFLKRLKKVIVYAIRKIYYKDKFLPGFYPFDL